ncbi:MAG: phytanoyl-CoA dioxygenase, partial [Deltaproteobacteria bacterium]
AGHLDTSAGSRLVGNPDVHALVATGQTLQRIASEALGTTARAVRAVLFDKTAANNWPLGWHQDRVIAVKERAEVQGFGPFTVKQSILHVQPPAEVIAGMATLRAHLDPVDAENAPLLIARGSHVLGLVPVDKISGVVECSDVVARLAGPGDIWVYRTLILHASEAAKHPHRRRVLQVDFAAVDLPEPLEWLGV